MMSEERVQAVAKFRFTAPGNSRPVVQTAQSTRSPVDADPSGGRPPVGRQIRSQAAGATSTYAAVICLQITLTARTTADRARSLRDLPGRGCLRRREGGLASIHRRGVSGVFALRVARRRLRAVSLCRLRPGPAPSPFRARPER